MGTSFGGQCAHRSPLWLGSGQALVPLEKTRDFGMTPQEFGAVDFKIAALPSYRVTRFRASWAGRKLWAMESAARYSSAAAGWSPCFSSNSPSR